MARAVRELARSTWSATPRSSGSTSLDDPDGAATPLVLAKVEYLNPGGSVKDRIALRMIEAAEASGELQPGGTIVEPTSRQHRRRAGDGRPGARATSCVFVCPDKVSEDKRNVLKAYGAEVVVCPTAVAPEHPDSYYSVSDRLVARDRGAWKPDQYSNPNNPRSHYETTGPEIWEQTDGRITHFVAGVGTGGTISGVGRYLKEVRTPTVQVDRRRPARARSTPAAPAARTSSRASARTSGPTTYDRDGRRRDHRGLRRRLVRDDPSAGPRGGAAGRRLVRHGGRRRAAAGHELAGRPTDAVVVVLLPDCGRGYLTKIFNDEWMAQYGFLDGADRASTTVGEVLRGKAGDMPALVHTHPNETIARGGRHPARVRRLADAGGPGRAAGRGRPRSPARSPSGTCSTRCSPARRTLTDPVEQHMSPPLPTVGSSEPVGDAVALLEDADAVLVLEDGKPVGVLTRQDLLAFLATSGA